MITTIAKITVARKRNFIESALLGRLFFVDSISVVTVIFLYTEENNKGCIPYTRSELRNAEIIGRATPEKNALDYYTTYFRACQVRVCAQAHFFVFYCPRESESAGTHRARMRGSAKCVRTLYYISND